MLRILAGLMLASLSTVCPAENPPISPDHLPGILYTNVVIPEVPWSIQVVEIKRGNPVYEIQTRHASGGALGLETLSDQVAALETERSEPVAAINGGFFLRDNGQSNAYAGFSRGLQIVEGRILSAPDDNPSLWIDYQGQPQVARVSSRFEVIWPDGRETPFELNGVRAKDGIELYTSDAGTSTHTEGGKELVLEPPSGGNWRPLHMEREYSARVRATSTFGNTPLLSDTLVLSLGPAVMEQFSAVTTGAVVRIATKTMPSLQSAKTALSGGPLLVSNGKAQTVHAAPDAAYAASSMLERHPRTAFGWNDETYFLVQVDGRQKDLSLGMTVDELSAFLIKLGCQEAINLDGGGSSCLWFAGRIRNSPCDGYERQIANALVVLRKKSKTGGSNLRLANPDSQPIKSAQNGN